MRDARLPGPLLFAFFLLAALLCAPPAAGAADPPGQSWSLPAGFSFLGLTVEPPAGHSADDLLDAAPALDAVYRFVPSTQAFQYRLVLPGGARFGEDFPIEPGAGYAVKARQPVSLAIPGTSAAARTAPLAQGFTLVALPALEGAPGTRTLLSRDARLKSVFAWNAQSQSFEFTLRLPDDSAFGSERALAPGDAVFLQASAAGTVDLGPLAIPAGTTPEALDLSVSALRVAPGATVDLAEISVTLRYPGGATRDVVPAWSAPAGEGEIAGLLYTTPATEGVATITAAWSEGDLSLTALLEVTRAADAAQAPPVEKIAEFTLDPATRLVDGETLAVSSVAPAEIILSAASGTAPPAVGEILIGYEGDGFLRKVETVAVEGSVVRVTTRDARLEEAFENLDYSFRGGLADLEARTLAPMRSPGDPRARIVARYFAARLAAARRAAAGNLIDSSKLGKILQHTKLSVELTAAELSFEPRFEVDLIIRNYSLRRFLYVVGGEITGRTGLKISVTGAVDLPIKGEVTVFKALPLPFLIGPVPFTFEWDVNLGIDAHCDAAGEMDFATTFSRVFRLGAEYTYADGWRQVRETSGKSSSAPVPTFKGLLEVQCYLEFEFALKILAVSGPELALKIYNALSLEVQNLTKVVVTVKAGVEAAIAAVVELYSWEMAEYKAVLAKFEILVFKAEHDFSDIPPPTLAEEAASTNSFLVRVVPPPEVDQVLLGVNGYHYRTLYGAGPWSVLVQNQSQSSLSINPNADYTVTAKAVKVAVTGTRESAPATLRVTTLPADPEEIVEFKDPALHRLVRDIINYDSVRYEYPALALPDGEPLRRRHLTHSWLTWFYVQSPLDPELHKNIATLEGIEKIPEIKRFVLGQTQVTSLAPLATHLSLEELELRDNEALSAVSIQDLPVLKKFQAIGADLAAVTLARLPALTEVTVTSASLSALAFTDLPTLASFSSLGLGSLRDLSFLKPDQLPALASITLQKSVGASPDPIDLNAIDLDGFDRLAALTVIANFDRLRLANLPKFTTFEPGDDSHLAVPRPIVRIELDNLPLLSRADSFFTPGSATNYYTRKVSGEVILRGIGITAFHNAGQTIPALTLEGLPALASFTFHGGGLASLTARDLPAVTTCWVTNTNLSSMAFVGAMPALQTLTLTGNAGVTAVEGLANATALTGLDLSGNAITATGQLPSSLVGLNLAGNPLDSISGLSGLSSLKYLRLGGTGIASITPLSGLAALELLELQGNRITDLSPLVANAGLGAGDTIHLENNPDLKLSLTDQEDEDYKNYMSLRDRGVFVFK